ncbi:MAG: cytochrome c1 [Gammaproteobacteria bacterium]|nr:cytochrome c1 [Gammaproteobacteria bacterium]
MNRTLVALILMCLPLSLFSAEEHGPELEKVRIDLSNQASLQNGARIFVNFCLSCHSASYMRYNRMASDLGISDDLLKEHLMFTADKPGNLMKTAMSKEDAEDWFGVAPPDLSVVARSRKPAWIYTYLRSFYVDENSATGWNNTVFENVAMPNVFYEWQGKQRAVFETEKLTTKVKSADGTEKEKETEVEVFGHFELETPGLMSPQEFDNAIRDLVNFLVYLGEPAKLERYRIGIFVMLFLGVLFVLTYLLKKEYWKDIH